MKAVSSQQQHSEHKHVRKTSKVLGPMPSYGEAHPNEYANDVLFATDSSSVAHPCSWIKRTINAQQTPTVGTTFDYHIKNTGYLGEMYLVSCHAAGTGNMTQYPGTVIVQHFELWHKGTLIGSYDYWPTWGYIMQNMQEKGDEFLYAWQVFSGGAALASGNICTPLWSPWSRLIRGHETAQPLPLFLLDDDLVVRVTLRAAASYWDAGATPGALSSMELCYQEIHTSDELRRYHFAHADQWDLKSVDIQSQGEAANTIATATATNVGLNWIQGDLNRIFWRLILVTNVTTAMDHHINDNTCSLAILTLDGQEHYRARSHIELEADTCLFEDQNLQDGTNFHGQQISFSIDPDPDHCDGFSGSFNTASSNDIVLNVTHAAGADCYCQAIGICDANYVIRNGSLERHR
jgi:hypothetical protein